MNGNAIVGNWRTSLAGAIFGVVAYLTSNGMTLPTSKEEFKNAGVSLGFLLLGALAKDASTGSKAN